MAKILGRTFKSASKQPSRYVFHVFSIEISFFRTASDVAGGLGLELDLLTGEGVDAHAYFL